MEKRMDDSGPQRSKIHIGIPHLLHSALLHLTDLEFLHIERCAATLCQASLLASFFQHTSLFMSLWRLLVILKIFHILNFHYYYIRYGDLSSVIFGVITTH